MNVKDAEWLLQQHKTSTYNIPNGTVDKAKALLNAHPYIKYNCCECDIECSERLNTLLEREKLCHRCSMYFIKNDKE